MSYYTKNLLTEEERSIIIERYGDLKFKNEVDNKFKCVKCNRVAIIHYFTNCNHLLCKNCKKLFSHNLEKFDWKCPLCKGRIRDSNKQDLNFDMQILDLNVHCLNWKYGCDFTATLSEIPKHLNSCTDTREASLPRLLEDDFRIKNFSHIEVNDRAENDLEKKFNSFSKSMENQLQQIKMENLELKEQLLEELNEYKQEQIQLKNQLKEIQQQLAFGGKGNSQQILQELNLKFKNEEEKSTTQTDKGKTTDSFKTENFKFTKEPTKFSQETSQFKELPKQEIFTTTWIGAKLKKVLLWNNNSISEDFQPKAFPGLMFNVAFSDRLNVLALNLQCTDGSWPSSKLTPPYPRITYVIKKCGLLTNDVIRVNELLFDQKLDNTAKLSNVWKNTLGQYVLEKIGDEQTITTEIIMDFLYRTEDAFSSDGYLLWQVQDYSNNVKNMEASLVECLYSPYVYTSANGYRLKYSLYVSFNLVITVYILTGLFDDYLPSNPSLQVTVSLFPKGNYDDKKKIKTVNVKSSSKFINLIPKAEIDNFIYNDELLIEINVTVNDNDTSTC